MAKEQKIIGLSREFIIHPGETLQEILDDREMSQKELAVRTGMSEKHISTVVNGVKPISVSFAKKLEYALGIETAFWINLQSNYDRELLEFEELNEISEQELSVLKILKDVIEFFSFKGWMNENDNPAVKVLDLRKIMNISNLEDIPNLAFSASFRAQVKNNKVDPYVLFAWQRMCELITKDMVIADELDVEKLKSKLLDIKQIMFLPANKIQNRLEQIFAECGIAFKIVRNFKGAPVQGFIKNTEDERIVLCMTIRQGFADIFWFSLFHEIAHIINGDAKTKFIDFDSVSGEMEEKADRFARNILIPLNQYKRFIAKKDIRLVAIREFANQCGVQTFIVLGRLMKDGILDWNAYSRERIRYVWE